MQENHPPTHTPYVSYRNDLEHNLYPNQRRNNICMNTMDILRTKRDIMIRKNLVLIVGVLIILGCYSIATGRKQIQGSSVGMASNFDFSPATIQTKTIAKKDTLNLAKRFMQIQERVRPISGYDALLDATSPQFLALDWIGNRDGYQIDPSDPLLIQRYALAVLYFSTNGLKWKKPLNWLTDVHECEWKGDGGVRKCNEMGEVTDLSLWNGLSGTIPSEIMHLTKLEVLYLSRNKLVGTIPSEISNLNRLTYLGLQHNKLTGSVPKESFASMSSLRYLYLEKNDLTGTIRRTEYPCLLMKDNHIHKKDQNLKTNEDESIMEEKGQLPMGLISEGSLEFFTSDCRALLAINKPEITCACCTQCFLA